MELSDEVLVLDDLVLVLDDLILGYILKSQDVLSHRFNTLPNLIVSNIKLTECGFFTIENNKNK